MIKLLNYFIAFVWLANGLLCKVLNLVPRHRLIVSEILGDEHAIFFTRIIGSLEILMAIWIISFIKSRICAIVQIIIIAAMNIIEFIKVPGLLLFGKMNILLAFIFILLIYINAFVINRPPKQ